MTTQSRVAFHGVQTHHGGSFLQTFGCCVLLVAAPLIGQANVGELRIRVVDPAGHQIAATMSLVNDASQYRSTLRSNPQGYLDLRSLPYGSYQIRISQSGFAPLFQSVVIRGPLPNYVTAQLRMRDVMQTVIVTSTTTLIDPEQSGTMSRIGQGFIQDRLGSLPGRSLQDLVNSQPGWLYEGNAVLHPRGSEYQTQFVVDGLPLTDNRSPSFGPEIEADDVQSIGIYTAGIPAEYGRKLGGVVELNTFQDREPGLHGKLVLSSGSFDTAQGFAEGQYTRSNNTIQVSADGSMTSRYLNSVVPQNYSNTGTLGDFFGRYERELDPNRQFSLSLRHELSRYDIPNEQLQQAAGQRQTADKSRPLGPAHSIKVFKTER